MSTTFIEPGLLRLFRWYVAIRLGILLLLLGAAQEPKPGDPLNVPQAGIVILGLLLAYLFSNRLRDRLGKRYLPIAVLVATLGPIIENAVTVNARLAVGASANEAAADYWLYFFYLFVPLIIVAWQYRYRWVVVFAAGTFFLDGAFTMAPLEETGADLALVGALMLGRSALFAFVGLIVNRLVTALRRQRDAVAESAIARERLAMSEERRRLARELHDTLAHTLSALAVQLEGATSVWDEDPAKSRLMVERSLESARDGLTEARRSITALRATPLEDGGLPAALEDICRSATETSGVEVGFSGLGPGPSDPDVQHTAFRIASEALTNVVRHSGATSAVISLAGNDVAWRIVVEDNGTGFDPDTAADGGHVGIAGMRERAESIGASFDITPGNEGGTLVHLQGGS